MDSRKRIVSALEAADGAMPYADLREVMSDRDVRTYNRMKASGDLHNYWVVDGKDTPAILHVSLEPRENEYHEIARAAAPAPSTPSGGDS
jgi:hypothetical protein